ncbi:MAG: radical SAM protein [Candidatus Sulfotelmatobacter sp.]
MSVRIACVRSRKPRILVVNCYFDDLRENVPRTRQIPMAMGPAYLAGVFNRNFCDVRLYDEVSSGSLEDPQLLSWPDMLVLTGLTTGFDRMLHVTGYARSLSGHVIVVAGGPGIRSFPHYARSFFDYCCLGDIEELGEVAREVFDEDAVAEEITPRFDLAYWVRNVGHIESSRNCNFRCAFCSMSAEGRGYQKYDLDYTRKQILAIGYKDFFLFIDNNFYGNDRTYFRDRIHLLGQMYKNKCFGGWGALVTNDFFYDDTNLESVRESGCVALFTGLESFDSAWLTSMNKGQNNRLPQVEMIAKCLNAGILFLYGLMLDVTSRTVDELERELQSVMRTPEITLPSFLSLPIPFPGTPFFEECVEKRRLLPNTRIRDLNSSVLSLKPLESMARVQPFIAKTQTMNGYRKRILRHTFNFYRRYRKLLGSPQMRLYLMNSGLLCAHEFLTAPGWIGRGHKRTYVSSSERLDQAYQPAFRINPRYQHYFSPTMLTDSNGEIAADLQEDLSRPVGVRNRSDILNSRVR